MPAIQQAAPAPDDALYLVAVDFSLEREGKLSDRADDPGGVTKWGIAHNRHPEIPLEQLLAMTRDDAIAFYRARYWRACGCDRIAALGFFALALAVFEAAVNQGQGEAAKLLQRAAGVAVDGRVGPVTIAAIAHRDEVETLCDFMARRGLSYVGDGGFADNGHGWFRRLFLAAAFGLSRDRPSGR